MIMDMDTHTSYTIFISIAMAIAKMIFLTINLNMIYLENVNEKIIRLLKIKPGTWTTSSTRQCQLYTSYSMLSTLPSYRCEYMFDVDLIPLPRRKDKDERRCVGSQFHFSTSSTSISSPIASTAHSLIPSHSQGTEYQSTVACLVKLISIHYSVAGTPQALPKKAPLPRLLGDTTCRCKQRSC